MGFGKSGKVPHDTEIERVESVRQSAAGVAGVSQATVKTAEIAYYRAALASARANGIDQGGCIHALWVLGVRDA